MKKVFISVGEVSGDTYASYIVQSLNHKYHFTGIAGKKMIQAGVKPVATIDQISVVGVVEALSRYRDIKKVFNLAVDSIKGCDTVVVVDFPGFNIKLIQQAKKFGKKVIYFISPQIWAWHYSRIYKIVENTDLLISILPFEEQYYKPFVGPNFQFRYFGHPLLDIVKPGLSFEEFVEKFKIPDNRKLIGLLPGSRESEVRTLLPVMIDSARLINSAFADTYFLVPITDNVKNLASEIVSKFGGGLPIRLITSKAIQNPSYDVMKHSMFSVIASGTATLEASIIGNPFVLVYKVNPLTFYIGKKLVKIKYLGLPNIIAGQQVIDELLQDECNSVNIGNKVLDYLTDRSLYNTTKDRLLSVREKLGSEGALNRIVEEIDNFIHTQ